MTGNRAANLARIIENETKLTAIYGEHGQAYGINNPEIADAELEALNNLPSEFIRVTDALPPHDKPVLAIRRAGYISSRYEVMTARYMLDYRPKSPWRDISGDAVSGSGGPILGWLEAPEWLQ